MPIKYLIAIIVAILLYFQIQSYSSNENSLERTLKNYQAALLNEEVEDVVDYLYPKYYNEHFTKEKLYQKQKKIFETSSVNDLELMPIFPIKTYTEGSYILVKYSKDITLDLPPVGTTKTDKRARRMALFFLKESLNKGDTLHVNKVENSIDIQKHGTLIFINHQKSGWKYIDVEATPKRLFKKILPMDIFDKEQVLILHQDDTMYQQIFQSKARK